MGRTKLTKLQYEHVIQLLAWFKDINYIVDYLKSRHRVKITYQNIRYYRDTKKKEILAYREKLGKDLLATPISNKFYRQEKRQELIDDLKDKLWMEEFKVILGSDGKPIVDKKTGEVKKELIKRRGNHTHLNQILDSAQREIEPLKIAQTDPTGEKPAESDFWKAVEKLPVDVLRRIRDEVSDNGT